MRTIKSILLALAIIANLSVSVAQINQATPVLKNGNEIFVAMTKFTSLYPADGQGHVYGKTAIREILNIQGLEKIFVFNGLSDAREIKIVFKAADKSGTILSSTPSYDNGWNCPPFCPTGGDDSVISSIGAQIDEGLAQQMILNFQESYRSRVKAQVFEKENFEQVLKQSAVEGLFFCNALNEKGEQKMVIVGVDKNGNLMWDGVVIDNSTPVPAYRSLNYPLQAIAAQK